MPPLRNSLSDFGTHGAAGTEIAEIAQAWVSGTSIRSIADRYFGHGDDLTSSISDATRAINRSLSFAGAWGLAALSRLPPSGIEFDALSEEERALINSLPARLYHGVNTDEAVLMRMAGVPRSIAVPLGERFGEANVTRSPGQARAFLKSLTLDVWDAVTPPGVPMTGADYQAVWSRLSGERVSRDEPQQTGP